MANADRERLDDRFSAAYEELRRLAARVLSDDAEATLNPTALVNEAWLKLAGSPRVADTSPLHFRRIAGRAMRQVLIESARRRRAGKRGSGAALLTLDEALAGKAPLVDDLLALDQLLEQLARLSTRQAQVVEGRVFGGLELSELAEELGVSEATILRDWRAARAWLARELTRASSREAR
jgi:RNA polymerase sigma factor (TIGR02999 family)